MNVLIRTHRYYYSNGDTEPSVVLYRGNLDYIPRIGEYIQVWNGWCLEKVAEVNYSVETNEITIVLDTNDSNREYIVEAKKRKIKQWGDE